MVPGLTEMWGEWYSYIVFFFQFLKFLLEYDYFTMLYFFNLLFCMYYILAVLGLVAACGLSLAVTRGTPL